MPPAFPDSRFLSSAQAEQSPAFDLANFDQWFEDRMRHHHFEIEQIPFAELQKWGFDPQTGNLRHESGKFFQIQGISVETNFGGIKEWRQPIINQPEIGFLGFITKEIDGVLHFLMQAKMEPGNIRCIQLAPTLQATKSNYTRVHQGKSPPFLEYFRENPNRRVLVDVLQSEQGGRFLRKRNRNIIIEIPPSEALPENPDYIWLTLGQIQQLLRRNNVINMDARTVLSCISFHRDTTPQSGSPSIHSMDEILTWFTELKCRYDLETHSIPLREAYPWQVDTHRVFHPEGKFFEVIAVRVAADNREVSSWTQPLVKPCRDGLIAFVTKDFEGETHFLIQGKVEAGNFDIVEMAPTVQCLTGDYKQAPLESRPPFVDYVLSASPEQILFDTMQSEEGGRFFREENRNLILRAASDFPTNLPPNYIWISHTQLKDLIRFSNIVNIQARCLLSACGAEMAKK
jgi:oxidase EvaA